MLIIQSLVPPAELRLQLLKCAAQDRPLLYHLLVELVPYLVYLRLPASPAVPSFIVPDLLHALLGLHAVQE